jgi:hypothetical protein
LPDWSWRKRSSGSRERSEYENDLLDADAPTGREAAELEVTGPWKPETLEIRSLDPGELVRYHSRWLDEVRAQLLVDPVVAAENADALVQEVMHARGYPVDPLDWHLGHLTVDQAQLVRSYHDVQVLADVHDSLHAVRAVQQYHHLFDELVETGEPTLHG